MTPAVPGRIRRTRTTTRTRKTSLLGAAVVAVVVPGLFATVALPAYAFVPEPEGTALAATVALEQYTEANAQTVVVDAGATTSAVAREQFSATTQTELAAARATTASTALASSGGTPISASVDLNQIVAIGQQYLGTPYVFGGADPSGFDCSGFVKYVFAQVGVALPHSVGGQAAAGTPVATADALPGDLVIMAGHDGIYMGDGMIMDAPKPGGVVSIRPIWTSSYSIVRIGA